jgi:hypothetical protein
LNPSQDATPETVAMAFLGALDAELWLEAAQWLHPDSAEAFRTQQLELIRMEEKWPNPPSSSDVHFTGPAEMLRVRNASEADALSASEVFARFAASVGPGAHSSSHAPLRLRRVLLGVERTTSGATALYRSDVYTGDTPLPHFPWWNDVRELRLVKTPQGWRVQDVNLGVTGDGHLLLSGAQMALLRGGAWLGSWRSDKGGEGGGGNRLK